MTVRTRPAWRHQKGAALLVIMLVIMMAATAVLVSRLDSTELRAQRVDATGSALAVARQALIDYATVQPDMSFGLPGTLPCPDIDDSLGLDEGTAHTSDCGPQGTSVIGRFPWRTLGIEPPRDGSAACLWYIVSGSWKNASTATAAMINPDSNGQLQLWSIEAGTIIEGIQPEDRPVAMLLAPMDSVAGQSRAAAIDRQCSGNFLAADFLDTDSLSGISNAVLTGNADVIDLLAVSAGGSEQHNDRIAIVTRADLETARVSRPDFEADMRALGLAVAGCLADYARHNPGGPDDRRLPWPAPESLPDYRPDAAYDDANTGLRSGRLPDIVDDTNSQTGNPTTGVLVLCDTAAVVTWTPGMHELWRHWKDHFYYVVAESFTADAAVPSNCVNCLTVNGVGLYSAVVVFANSRLDALAQRRNAPPIDIDTKGDIRNYLEDANASAFPYVSGGLDLRSQTATTTFNDLLFCIDDTLAVGEC